jgi:hypothetical protein
MSFMNLILGIKACADRANSKTLSHLALYGPNPTAVENTIFIPIHTAVCFS